MHFDKTVGFGIFRLKYVLSLIAMNFTFLPPLVGRPKFLKAIFTAKNQNYLFRTFSIVRLYYYLLEFGGTKISQARAQAKFLYFHRLETSKFGNTTASGRVGFCFVEKPHSVSLLGLHEEECLLSNRNAGGRFDAPLTNMQQYLFLLTNKYLEFMLFLKLQSDHDLTITSVIFMYYS